MFMSANPAHAYRRVDIESDAGSASPYRLVQMLYDGAHASVLAARTHLAAGRLADKGMAVSRAIRIVDEGLKASLDHARGGELAGRLSALYDYITLRLLAAGRDNDDAILAEVERLLGTLREAWQGIDPAASATRVLAPRPAFGGLVAA